MLTPILNFFFPKFTWWFALRLLLWVTLLPLFFIFICRPAWVNGNSMLPTYHTGQFLPVWRPAYWHGRTPQPGEVVMLRYRGEKILLLKRVVALAGQTVAFQDGQLLVDGQPCQDFWGKTADCDWNMPPHLVSPGCIYVIGDNRSMPMENHEFGEASLQQVLGRALW